MVEITDISSSFLVYLKSLKIEQTIPNCYEKNAEMVVVDIDFEKQKVKLRQSNLSDDSAKWFSEIDFVNSQLAR